MHVWPRALVIVGLVAHASKAHAGGATAAKSAAGSIAGVVSFKGEAPAPKKLVRDSDPVCAATERFNEDIVVTDGKLRDVLVRVTQPPVFDAATLPKQVVINQNQCMYEPRVVGVVAGQALAVQNGDPTFHNVRATLGDQALWNNAHPKAAPAIVKENVGKAGDVVELHCDVHPWMHAYAYVQASPYFAVTNSNGSFTIAGLPPGNYVVEAVHPVLGTKTAKVKIGAGAKAKAKASFTFAAK